MFQYHSAVDLLLGQLNGFVSEDGDRLQSVEAARFNCGKRINCIQEVAVTVHIVRDF